MTYKNYAIYGVVVVLIILLGSFLYMGSGKTGANPPPVPGKQVIYTDSGFLPQNLSVKAGDVVVFKNESTGDMWVGSNPHPVHTDLPGFDALRGFAPGESYSYTFEKAGTWGYHNHKKPSQGGTVTVQ